MWGWIKRIWFYLFPTEKSERERAIRNIKKFLDSDPSEEDIVRYYDSICQCEDYVRNEKDKAYTRKAKSMIRYY